MSDLALDASGDLELVAGRARVATGAECVGQLWASHLTLFRGEWFLDRNLGIDYQNEVLEKGIPLSRQRAIFAQASRETPGLDELTDLRVSLSPDRTLDVQAQALTNGEPLQLQLAEQIGGA